jgi:hypothetical protein
MLQAQRPILVPLREPEPVEFMRILRTLVTANNELSRTRSDGCGRPGTYFIGVAKLSSCPSGSRRWK